MRSPRPLGARGPPGPPGPRGLPGLPGPRGALGLCLWLALGWPGPAAGGVGQRAFRACAAFGRSMLECHNELHPAQRVRVPADRLLFPHMALVGYGGEGSATGAVWQCGGSLLAREWVLTAAHCLQHPALGAARALRVGTATFEFDEEPGLAQERAVARAAPHPAYRPPAKYNDIALLRAAAPFALGRDVRPACLWLHEELPGGALTATGFGSTSAGAARGSRTLLAVDVHVVDRAACNRTLRALARGRLLPQGLRDDQFCAGDVVRGGRDTCQGDSGGPLQLLPRADCRRSFPLHAVVGVTSFGRDCGRRSAPGVYTRVSRYVGWIEGVVWPDEPAGALSGESEWAAAASSTTSLT